jgi:hypothetical protein
MNFLNNIYRLLNASFTDFSQTYRLERAQTKKMKAEEIWSKLNSEQGKIVNLQHECNWEPIYVQIESLSERKELICFSVENRIEQSLCELSLQLVCREP